MRRLKTGHSQRVKLAAPMETEAEAEAEVNGGSLLSVGRSAGVVYEVSFSDPGTLGFAIIELDDRRPAVEEVVQDSIAEKMGVRIDDLVIGIDGRSVKSYAYLLRKLSAAGRPVRLRFMRPPAQGAAGAHESTADDGKAYGKSALEMDALTGVDEGVVVGGHNAVAAELLTTVSRVESENEGEEPASPRSSSNAFASAGPADRAVGGEEDGDGVSVGTGLDSLSTIGSAMSLASAMSHIFVRAGVRGRKVAQEIALVNLVTEWQTSGKASIFEACRRNDVGRVSEILSEAPFAVNMTDFGGNTPLQLACMLRCHEVATLLIEKGADVLRPDPIGIAPLQYVKEAVHKVRLQRTADMFAKDETDFLDDDSTVQGNTNIIRDAAYRGDGALIEALLQQEPSLLHAVDKKGHTPLIFACMGQQIDTACFLLERGADLYAQTSYGWQADRFVRDKWKREKLLMFAFKVSPEGRAQAAAAFQKRKDEARMALQDSTDRVMEDIRTVIRVREERLRLRAEALTAFSLRKADDYLVVGELRAVEHSIREFMDEQERLEELERLRLVAEEEERVRQREAFIAASIAAVMERRAQEAAERAEQERLQRLAEEEAERLRIRLEIAAKVSVGR